jgi:hypothetical protein
MAETLVLANRKGTFVAVKAQKILDACGCSVFYEQSFVESVAMFRRALLDEAC